MPIMLCNVYVSDFYKPNITQTITYNNDNPDHRFFQCLANATEQCNYRWMKPTDSLFEVLGQILVMSEQNVDLHPIHCRAACKLRGISCEAEPLIIEFSSDKGWSLFCLITNSSVNALYA